MRKRKFNISSVSIFLLFLGFSTMTAAAADEDFSGYWAGTWVGNQGGSGTFTTQLTQNGSSVSGTHTSIGGQCPPEIATVSGTVTGNVLSAEIKWDCGGLNVLSKEQWVLTNNHCTNTWTVYRGGSITSSGTGSGTRLTNVINATAGTGGVIIPAGKISVNAGSDKTFKIVPNNGYKILDVLVDGVSAGAKTSYTFNKVSANHTITVTFETASTATGSIVPTIVAPLLIDE